MVQIGYQASHEQFAPSALLKYVIMAQEAGFSAINSSDHFAPWSERQGQSGFSFAWLGAAMQATRLPYGVVCTPGQRYHPAIVAQAAATLGEMFPGRFWIALGSGEAINENITGDKWPEKGERNKRLFECFEVIKRLFDGEEVTHNGLIKVEKAKLYTRPEIKPLLFCAALSTDTAAWAGSWADGMITAHKPHEEMKQVVDAFRNNGGEGKPIYLKVQLSYAHAHEEALQGAYEQWRTNIFQGGVLGDMPTTAHFDAAAEFVKPEDLYKMVRISSDLEQHIEWIKKDTELGFEKIILHNVNTQQEIFIKNFGRHVLPHFQ
jgi:coenzyme F420-dependent glucose-6-phosphate dehydrogenase